MKLSAVRLIATIQPFTFNATESQTLVQLLLYMVVDYKDERYVDRL